MATRGAAKLNSVQAKIVRILLFVSMLMAVRARRARREPTR